MVTTVENILNYLSDLNIQLKKHPDVKSIYRQPTEIEKDFKISALNDSWNAFTTNLKMLRGIKLEGQDENMPTLDVLEAAFRLFSYPAVDEIGIKLIIEKEDNLLLFIDTAAMLVLFCVNCQITRRISTLMDNELTMKDTTNDKKIYRGRTIKRNNRKLICNIYN